MNSGLLDESLHLVLDYDLWIRMGRRYKMHYLQEDFALSRMYSDNKTMSRRQEAYQEAFSILEKHYGYVPLSWIKSRVDYDNPSASNLEIAVNASRYFIRENINNPLRILKDFMKAFHRQMAGKIRWK